MPPPEAANQLPTPFRDKPPPYSVPLQLRPAAATNAIRSDTAFAFHKVADQSVTTVVSTLFGSYKITPELAVLARVGVVHDSPSLGTACRPS